MRFIHLVDFLFATSLHNQVINALERLVRAITWNFPIDATPKNIEYKGSSSQLPPWESGDLENIILALSDSSIKLEKTDSATTWNNSCGFSHAGTSYGSFEKVYQIGSLPVFFVQAVPILDDANDDTRIILDPPQRNFENLVRIASSSSSSSNIYKVILIMYFVLSFVLLLIVGNDQESFIFLLAVSEKVSVSQ